jgi:hypothetical protein
MDNNKLPLRIKLNIFRLFLSIYFFEFQGHKQYWYKQMKALVSVRTKTGKRVMEAPKKYY